MYTGVVTRINEKIILYHLAKTNNKYYYKLFAWELPGT